MIPVVINTCRYLPYLSVMSAAPTLEDALRSPRGADLARALGWSHDVFVARMTAALRASPELALQCESMLRDDGGAFVVLPSIRNPDDAIATSFFMGRSEQCTDVKCVAWRTLAPVAAVTRGIASASCSARSATKALARSCTPRRETRPFAPRGTRWSARPRTGPLDAAHTYSLSLKACMLLDSGATVLADALRRSNTLEELQCAIARPLCHATPRY